MNRGRFNSLLSLTREHNYNYPARTDVLTVVLPGSAFPSVKTVAQAAGFPDKAGANDHSGATVADFHRIPFACNTYWIVKEHPEDSSETGWCQRENEKSTIALLAALI